MGMQTVIECTCDQCLYTDVFISKRAAAKNGWVQFKDVDGKMKAFCSALCKNKFKRAI
jgi:hypothetical protein